MYDFYFGSNEEIVKDEIKYLIAIKRMMPRWVNSLPDSEFMALAKILDEQGRNLAPSQHPVFVETGAGASSLLFAFYALKYDGLAFSWDINAEKGSLIRTVCTETMCNHFRKHIDNHWKLVAFNSLSPYMGLSILTDLVNSVDVFFHDSEHVWETIKKELGNIMPLLCDGSVVALDDANLNFLHTNLGYINTFRKKMGLSIVLPIEENECEPFYIEAERLLSNCWERIDYLSNICKKAIIDDDYYSGEPALNEKAGQLERRFSSWRVSLRK